MKLLRPNIAAAILLAAPSLVEAGAYVFAGDANGLDLVAHPQIYSGTGGLRPDLTVCIDTSVNPALAVQAEPSVIKAVETFNRFRPIPSNNLAFNANTDIPSGQIDFESTLLHEMGHCQGLAHPNHANESGLAGAERNGTKSSQGINTIFDQDAGPDTRHGSSDDLRGDDINLHWYIRNQNNPGLLPAVVDSSTMMRELTDLPAGHAFAANADRDVMNALGFPLTEAVMQQGAFGREAQRHLQHDDVVTLRLARAGSDRTAGNADDYSYQLRYVGQLNDPANADCNLRVRLDTSTGFAVCSLSGQFINATNIRVTRAELAFNSNSNWYFTPGTNTVTTVASTSPSPSQVGQPYSVNVTVREAPGITISGEPSGLVEVSDGVPAPDTSTCTIELLGTVNETGSCQLTTTVEGTHEVTAQYIGFAGWDAGLGSASHTTQDLAEPTTTTILAHLPEPSVVGQPYTVSVQVSSAVGTPSGAVAVDDGEASCQIAALAGGEGSCQLTSTSAGSKTLTAAYAGTEGFAGSSDTTSHQVDPSPTQTQILDNSPNPSAPGQAVTVSFAVSAAESGAGSPQGDVVVTATPGLESCTASIALGSCELVLIAPGERLLAAAFPGSPDFLASEGSAAHTVAVVSTTTSIQSQSPKTTVVGQPYVVTVLVESSSGTPTGTVVVDEGENDCETPALKNGSASCQLTSQVAGARTLTATYAGQGIFSGSSDSAGHQVDKAESVTVITTLAPSPSIAGELVAVEFGVVALPPGVGQPSGQVQVSADSGEDCSASVAEGGCDLQFDTAGLRVISADYAGDASFNPSMDDTTHLVEPAEENIFADGFEQP